MDERFKGTYFMSSISFSTMLCEYGLSSIFILFMIYVLHFSNHIASNYYSYYYGFAYFLPILIGFIMDKYLKRSTSLTIGIVSMILSQLILAFSSSIYQPGNIVYDVFLFNFQNITFIIGLFFMALGTGFTNTSVTAIINAINNDDLEIHAFSIYYPIINMGIMFGSLIMTLIIGEENYHLYQWSFLFFACVLIVGLMVFHLLKRKYLVDNEGKLMKDISSRSYIKNENNRILNRLSSKSIFEINKLNSRQKIRLFYSSLSRNKEVLFVFAIFLLINIFYRIAFSQSSLSMVFFIDAYVIRDVHFFEIPVQMFFIINPLYIILLSPLFIKLNAKLEEKNIEWGFVRRMIMAMFFMTLCFVLMCVLGFYLDVDALPLDKIHFIWILIFELLISISELFFSVASYSFVGDLAIENYYSLFFGMFTATRAISMYLSGKISLLFPEDEFIHLIFNLPVNGLMSYFMIFVAISLFGLVLLVIFGKKLDKIIKSIDTT